MRRSVRRIEIAAICIAAVCSAGVAGASMTTASNDPPSTTAPAPPTTSSAVRGPVDEGLPPQAPGVAVRLNREALQLAAVDRDRNPVAAQLAAADATVQTDDGFIAQNRTDLAVAQGVARARAADAYVRSSEVRSGDHGDDGVDKYASALQYSQAAASVDTTTLEMLTAVGTQLDAKRQDDVKTRDDLAARKAELDADHDRLLTARNADQAQLDGWGAVPLMGDATLTPAQIAAWYRSTGSVVDLPPAITIDDVAQLYVDEGAAEHVRGDVAFAQAMIETGGFSVDPGNNYAGIGTCDSCNGGDFFPTPRDGVRAQIQLLRNYGDPDSRAARLANPPDPVIYGTGPAAARSYDTFFLKGATPLWNDMGGGNWATDPVYAPKVIGMYADMVAFARAHPG